MILTALFYYGTNEAAPNGLDIIKNCKRNGDRLYFLTARKENNDPPHLSLNATRHVLDAFGLEYELIVGNMPSPRVLFNNEGATAVNVSTD